MERLLTADIAVMSAGHPGAVASARAFVRGAAVDRWRLELALERLHGSKRAFAGSHASMGGGGPMPVASCLGISAALVLALLTVPATGSLSTAGVALATAVAVAG